MNDEKRGLASTVSRGMRKLWRKTAHLLARHCIFNSLRVFLYRQAGAAIHRQASIGMDCYVDDYEPGRIVIERNAVISYRVIFVTHGPARRAGEPIVVERDAYIGANTVLLPGVKIGRGAIVGAGSTVTRDVEPMTVVAGCPARLIRRLHVTGDLRARYLGRPEEPQK